MEREYAYAICNGDYVYRIPGHRHGDGSVDTDETPVWLLCLEQDVMDAGLDPAKLREVSL